MLTKNAKEIVLIAKSSIFKKIAFSYIVDMRQINNIVTNLRPLKDTRHIFSAIEIRVHTIKDGVNE